MTIWDVLFWPPVILIGGYILLCLVGMLIIGVLEILITWRNRDK